MQEADDALCALAHVACLAHRFIDIRQNALAAFIKYLAGRRQFDMARIACQQQCLHCVFKFLDLPAQRRLGDIQFFRRPRITARIDDFDKIPELFDGDHSYAISRSLTALFDISFARTSTLQWLRSPSLQRKNHAGIDSNIGSARQYYRKTDFRPDWKGV